MIQTETYNVTSTERYLPIAGFSQRIHKLCPIHRELTDQPVNEMKYIAIVSICVTSIFGFVMSTYSPSDRPLRTFGNNVVTQIGFVVEDIEKSSRAYADLFGVEVPEINITDPLEKSHTAYRGEPTEARAKLAFFRLENITIELIEPVGGPSIWQEFLDTKGEGVHHIAFQVDDLDGHIALLEQNGGQLVQRGDFTGGSYTYVDTTPRLGTIIELLTSTD